VLTPHPTLAACNAEFDLDLATWPSAEAQIASLADDIAYHNHDMDDGLRAKLFSVDDLREIPLLAAVIEEVKSRYPALTGNRRVYEIVRRVMGAMVMDLLAQTRQNLAESGVHTATDIRLLGRPVAAFSPAMQETHRQLKAFLMEWMYRHYKVNRMTSKARRVVADLFAFFMAEPECLPTHWRRKTLLAVDANTQAAIIADYIAGMTDRYAMKEHRRLFDLTAQVAQE
jgi:dGTPase